MIYASFASTQIDAVEYIKDYIKDKRVVDLGGGDGTFCKALQLYAKDVTNVELDPELASRSRASGVKTFAEDFMTHDISQYDVIFVFLGFVGMYAFSQKLKKDNWNGTVISHYYPIQNTPTKLVEPDVYINVDIPGCTLPFLIYHL